jgi:hypothetical protein
MRPHLDLAMIVVILNEVKDLLLNSLQCVKPSPEYVTNFRDMTLEVPKAQSIPAHAIGLGPV